MDTLKNGLPGAFEDDEPEDGGGEIVGICVSIPPGTYQVKYNYYATGYFQESPKVTVYCSITDPEEYAGTPLERFYGVESLKGPPKRYGGFRAKARGDLNREVSGLLGPISRSDRISFACLRGKTIICEVETVTKDRDKKPLPSDLQYSRIARFVKILQEDW